MTGGRRIARNTLLNLVGLAAPMVVALVAIPLLVRGLGTDRFGVLTLVWMAIGYFSVFDLGLGRALTQRIAHESGLGREDEVPPLVWTGLVPMGVLGVAGTLLVGGAAPWLVHSLLRIPPELREETLGAFRILALSLPWVILTAGLRGVLEAKQRFDLVNLVRIPMGVFTFAAPLLVIPFSPSLVPIVGLLALGRVAACGVHLALCFRAVPGLKGRFAVRTREILPLLRFGGWMTVSNLISPLMVYLDRFLIGAMIAMSAVAYYVTPYEVVTRLWLVPAALLSVLFPAFAESFSRDRERTATLLDAGVRVTFVALFPIVLVVIALAPEGLTLWLGPEFAANSTPVLQLLAVGVFINSVGQLPYTALQAVGRPELTGKLHLAELPFYLLALWWLIGSAGITGAAIAWVGRVVIDTALLFLLAGRLMSGGTALAARTGVRLVMALAVFALVVVPEGVVTRLSLVGIVTAIFLFMAWTRILTTQEREALQVRLRAGQKGAVEPA